MMLTEEGLSLIRRFEGFRADAYLCPAGVWTIGYGHTGQAGSPAVSKGMVVTEAEARRILRVDAERFAADVRASLSRSLSDQQFSALVSFAFNVGTANFRKSSVLRATNAGDFEAVPRRLQLWIKGGGKVLPGLVKRRAAEAALFLDDSASTPVQPAAPPEVISGKPVSRSTTIAAAFTAMASALLQVFGGGGGRILSFALAALTVAAALWIIRERVRKSKEDGI